jgi:GNAT superfamily N-acetyltransferase
MSASTRVDTVVVTRTYLSMAEPSELRRGAAPAIAAQLTEMARCSVAEWRAMYAQVGRRWNWHDRDRWPDARLEERLGSGRVRVFRVTAEATGADTETMGFLELEQHDDGSVEIAYMGLDERVFGRGLGRWLVAEATATAFAWGGTRVWLHTCTLDSDTALPNYLARGFVPTHSERYEATIARHDD